MNVASGDLEPISRGEAHSAVHVAIYDGNCRVCTDFARVLRGLVPASRLDVVPCGSLIQRKLAPQVELSVCARDFTLALPDGTVLVAVDAVREALLLSPRIAFLRPVFESAPGRFIARVIHLGARRKRAKGGCCGGKNAPPPSP